MSLIICKECGKEVSTDAKTCPHCGKILKKPSIWTKKFSGCGCLALILLIISIYAIIKVSCDVSHGPGVSTTTVNQLREKKTIRKINAILEQYKDKWELVKSYAVIRLVYLAPSELKNERLISAILYKLRYIDDENVRILRVGFYDRREYASHGLPMTDTQMLHWKAQYNLNMNSGFEEFFFNTVVNSRISPPDIKSMKANIRPRLIE